MTVKRWDLESSYEPGGMESCDDGDYVTYEDYEQLQAENEKLRQVLQQWLDSITEAGNFYTNVFPDELGDTREALKGGEK